MGQSCNETKVTMVSKASFVFLHKCWDSEWWSWLLVLLSAGQSAVVSGVVLEVVLEVLLEVPLEVPLEVELVDLRIEKSINFQFYSKLQAFILVGGAIVVAGGLGSFGTRLSHVTSSAIVHQL